MSNFRPSEQADHERQPRSGVMAFALCVLGIVAVWGWALPAIGSLASVRAAIQRTEGQGINAGAIFYTDVFYSLELRRANQLVDKGN
jgi:uncharacterized RDD family membrane protein YckC